MTTLATRSADAFAPDAGRLESAARGNRSLKIGLALMGMFVMVALLSPLLASSQPIVCRYNGALYFPAVVDTLHNIPLIGRFAKKSPPFNYPGFDARTELDPQAFAIWTPIPYGPLDIVSAPLLPPSREHLLGTDNRGRDVAARLLHGAAVSVKVAFFSVAVAGLIGITIGAAAGYLGGWTDHILSRLIEMAICFPAFFLILSVMVWLEPSATNVIIVIGLTRWTSIARFARAEFLKLRSADFVVAARCAGNSAIRIAFRHVLPCALPPIVVTLTFAVADAILIEAGLSWLGYGVPTPEPSWGNLLRAAYDHLQSAPFLVYPPCIAIAMSVVVFHLLGAGLRRAIGPEAATTA